MPFFDPVYRRRGYIGLLELPLAEVRLQLVIYLRELQESLTTKPVYDTRDGRRRERDRERAKDCRRRSEFRTSELRRRADAGREKDPFLEWAGKQGSERCGTMKPMQRTAPAALYEADFTLWVGHQVGMLRQAMLEGRKREVDVKNVIEELEGLATRDRRSLESLYTTLRFTCSSSTRNQKKRRVLG